MTLNRRLPRQWWRVGALWAFLGLALVTGSGCSPFTPATRSQGNGLPTLHHLDWGFAWNSLARWSPNGRWIAFLAGSNLGDTHLEVVSSDGAQRYDLSSWGCGGFHDFDIAWLPDNRLTCIRASSYVFRLCTGLPTATSCQSKDLAHALQVIGSGAVWSPDGDHLIVAGLPGDPAGGAIALSGLNVLTPQGAVRQRLLTSNDHNFAFPQWRPHTSELSYLLDPNLVIRPISYGSQGFTLGTPRVVASDQIEDVSSYAWSPSGRWIALRHLDAQGNEKIYLVNADHPTQTADVVLTDKVGEQMTDPIWSPDGKTLIVFGVNDNQPYAINIADYLHSKGLEV